MVFISSVKYSFYLSADFLANVLDSPISSENMDSRASVKQVIYVFPINNMVRNGSRVINTCAIFN